MGNRVRHVVPSRQVAHLWANRSQDEAHNSCKSLFFENDTIFSYGRHFPIARHVEPTEVKGDCGHVVLFTTRGYSVTTSGHIADVRQALHGLGFKVFHVDNVTASDASRHHENFENYRKRLDAKILEFGKSRLYKDTILASARALVTQANEYARAFTVRAKWTSKRGKLAQLEVPEFDTMAIAARESMEKHKAERKQAAEAKSKREELRKQEYAKQVAEWKAGGDVVIPFHSDATTYLRVKGSRVQTSRGAIVPLDDARKLFKNVLGCKQQSTGAVPYDYKVGDFYVSEITSEGNLKAGCHFIKWEQIEELAKSQGWM